MAKALSIDLRWRVVEAVDAGMSRRAAAARFGVGVSSAIRWVKQFQEKGHLKAGKRGGDRRSQRIDQYKRIILERVEVAPDQTLGEIAGWLEEAVGYRPLPSVVCRFFQRHGITRKKRPPPRRSRTARM